MLAGAAGAGVVSLLVSVLAAAGVDAAAAGAGVAAAGAGGAGVDNTFGLDTITTMNLLSSIEYSESKLSSMRIFPA